MTLSVFFFIAYLCLKKIENLLAFNKQMLCWLALVNLTDWIELKLMIHAAEISLLAGQLADNYVKYLEIRGCFNEFISDDVVILYIFKRTLVEAEHELASLAWKTKT